MCSQGGITIGLLGELRGEEDWIKKKYTLNIVIVNFKIGIYDENYQCWGNNSVGKQRF